MRTRAAVALEAGKPLEVMEVMEVNLDMLIHGSSPMREALHQNIWRNPRNSIL